MSRKYNSILWKVLKEQMSEEEIYASFFHSDTMSTSEFGALVADISPDRYHEVINGITSASAKEYDQCSFASTKVRLSLLKTLEKNRKMKFFFEGDDIIMPSACFIEWAARNKLPLPKRFLENLSLSLRHVYIQFQPRNIALREASKFSTKFQKVRFQEAIDELFEQIPDLIPSEALKNKKITTLLKSFHNHDGKHQRYPIRTLKKWIAKDHPFPHGRPKKPKRS